MTFRLPQARRFACEAFSQLIQIKSFLNLRRSQWLTYPMLQRIQERKLRNIMKFAYDNVEYYHHLFKSLNLNPSDIRHVDDLRKIPILTKSEVQNNFEKITASDFDMKRCYLRRTSGSTGMPLSILFDDKALANIESRHFRSYRACGLKLRDKRTYFSAPQHFDRYRLWYHYIGFLRKENFSIFNPTHSNVSELIENPPDVIVGYPSVLFLIAEEIEDGKSKGINPRLIFSTSELLTPAIRKKINSVFESELFDQYGSVEFGTFAWECPGHGGYHIDVEDVVVEFLRNGEPVAPGEKGEIVLTSLFNYAMPLVRYSLGDIGTYSNEHCSCGRGLPLMKMIDGRADDFLVLPSGTRISPRNIGTLEYINGIPRVRITQEKKEQIIVQIVKGRNFSEKVIRQVREVILGGCLGENVEVNVELVEEIPRDKSGKIRMIKSKVKA